MKIAVTGATGQLGKFVIAHLQKQYPSEDIIALVRSVDKAESLGVNARYADYDKPETLEAALDGVDRLLLISSNEIGKRVSQHQNVLDAAQKQNVSYVVYTSLLHADKSSLSLAEEHLQTEALIKNSAIPYTILRNGWYVENYFSSLPVAVKTGVLVGAASEGRISAASRKDYAEAAAVVLMSDKYINQIIELAGGQAFTLSDLADEVSVHVGKKIAYQNMSVTEYTAVLVQSGMPETSAEFIADCDRGVAEGDLYHRGSELSDILGHPTTPLSEVLASLDLL